MYCVLIPILGDSVLHVKLFILEQLILIRLCNCVLITILCNSVLHIELLKAVFFIRSLYINNGKQQNSVKN